MTQMRVVQQRAGNYGSIECSPTRGQPCTSRVKSVNSPASATMLHVARSTVSCTHSQFRACPSNVCAMHLNSGALMRAMPQKRVQGYKRVAVYTCARTGRARRALSHTGVAHRHRTANAHHASLKKSTKRRRQNKMHAPLKWEFIKKQTKWLFCCWRGLMCECAEDDHRPQL